MANRAQFWSVMPGKQSFTSAKSPEPVGIAAHPRNRHGWGIQLEMLGWASPQLSSNALFSFQAAFVRLHPM
jgi:hypothetical protein